MPGATSSAATASSTTRRSWPTRCWRVAPSEWRSSTSTSTTATGRSRSSGSAPTCCTSASTATPLGSTRTSTASPPSAVPAMATGRPSTFRCRRHRWRRYLAALDEGLAAIRAFDPDAPFVVSLGFDTYHADPICNLGFGPRTTPGSARIAALRAGRGPPGGRLRDRCARRERGRLPRMPCARCPAP